MLWRPLTGIMSFNIPAYRFDLSPFAGELNAGGAHSMSITVVGNNGQGVWIVNPVLLAYQDHAFAGKRLGGEVDSTFDSRASFGVRKREDSDHVWYKTAGGSPWPQPALHVKWLGVVHQGLVLPLFVFVALVLRLCPCPSLQAATATA
jgi:hypothetical protein